ncbi:MAG TPA: 2-hydroxychromene-2-carboxylate isomerase [Rhizomicrobium sp.]|jgi:2-hydroxychromene-2-carboxylate isomerase|nr:2-hydroxychromene-2-carboxylate isomerase [Rhizomicrobium sp.]
MSARAEFLFDFGSPNAFLAHRVIPQIERRTGAKFEYLPVLLGGIFKATGNQSPMQAFGHIASKMAYEQLETSRFIRRHGIADFKFNPFFPVNTLNLMRMAVVAQAEGILPRYMDAVFRHMWIEPKKMDDPDVAKAALIASGLDPALLERAQAPDVKAKLIANTESAVARGAFGIPTFFVGTEMFFGKDRLRDVEEAIAAAR